MPATKSLNGLTALRPDKRLGQHFLRDRAVIGEILGRSGLTQTDNVLEIGPGLGALTVPLSRQVNNVIAVEKDGRLAKTLEERLTQQGITNVTLVDNDILKVDWETLPGIRAGMKAIGNLPYNISSPFLERLFRHGALISFGVFMFQYEFAERLLASPGGKDYGALTVVIRYDAQVSPLVHVSRDSFYPMPKVGSMVVKIDLGMPHANRAKDDRFFKTIVKAAFAHRRKTILNSLSGALPSFSNNEIREALTLSLIDPVRRAETVDIDEFIGLADRMMEF